MRKSANPLFRLLGNGRERRITGRSRRSAIAASAAALIFAGPLAAATSASARVAGPSASTWARDVNPDALPPTVTVKHCSDHVTSYGYRVAKGFNPLTATPAELLANKLPLRPASAAQFATWESFVERAAERKIHFTPDCSFGRGHPGSIDHLLRQRGARPAEGAQYESDSPNWDGNIADNEDYDYATATWNVPTVTDEGDASPEYSSSWASVGTTGSDAYPIVQAGTEEDYVDGFDSYYLWWEVFPYNSQQVLGSVVPGATVVVNAYLFSGDAVLDVIDESNNTEYDEVYTGSFSSDNTAAWIYERTNVGGTLYELPDSTTTFNGAEALATTGAVTPVGDLPHYYDQMYECAGNGAYGTEMAYDGAISSNGQSFTAYWKNQGDVSTAAYCGLLLACAEDG
jgi:hypothetical protein